MPIIRLYLHLFYKWPEQMLTMCKIIWTAIAHNPETIC